MPAGGSKLSQAATAFAITARSPALRRVQLAFGAAYMAEWAITVALGVIAFRDGGAAAVGLVALLRTAPAALLAPAGGALADRLPRDKVLVAVGTLRAAALAGGAALLIADAPLPAVYALAIVQTIAFTVFRPVHTALLPSLCRTPAELTSANVVRGLLDSVSALAGPFVAAILLAASTPAAVLVAAAVLSAASAALLVRLGYEPPPRAVQPGGRLIREAAEGLRVLFGQSDARLLATLGMVQTFTRGAFQVLAVVIAIDLLGGTEADVGVLTGAVGVGAVLGSLATSLLVGARRLGTAVGVGVTLWGLPLVFAGLAASEPVILVLLAFIGVGNAVMDVGYFTLLARILPDAVLGRVMTVDEGVLTLGVALGAAVAPVVIALTGIQAATVLIGLVGPVAVALAARRLRRLDGALQARDADIDALRRVEMLSVLPMPLIEDLAQHADPVAVPQGEFVFQEGDVGDRFYVILDGKAEVLHDGGLVRSMEAGQCFGEIALLRDVRRTATIRAGRDLELLAIERRHFVPTVLGYGSSAARAEAVVEERLDAFGRPAGVA